MKHFLKSTAQALITGLFLLTPVYLAILLLLKAMKSLSRIVRPLARLLPARYPVETVASFLLVLLILLLVGCAFRTHVGRMAWGRVEHAVLEKVPGYLIFRGMIRQLAGGEHENSWKPALAEIEEALVPAFIIEQLEDGCFTVFVPSVPTPLAGTIYVLSPDRVHPLNVPFTQAVKTVTRWGLGTKELVAAMEGRRSPSEVIK